MLKIHEKTGCLTLLSTGTRQQTRTSTNVFGAERTTVDNDSKYVFSEFLLTGKGTMNFYELHKTTWLWEDLLIPLSDVWQRFPVPASTSGTVREKFPLLLLWYVAN